MRTLVTRWLTRICSQDLHLEAAKQVASGLTTIEFSRKLNTGHSDDREIHANGTSMFLIWAIGDDVPSSDGSAFSKHSVKGVSHFDLSATSTCPASPPADTDGAITFSWTSSSSDFSMAWSIIDQTYLEVNMTGTTKGWVGLGFSDTNSMLYSDMVVGWVEDDSLVASVYDMYVGDKRGMPSVDSNLGGSDDVQLISGTQNTLSDGEVRTSLKWRRKLITSDTYDLDIMDRDIYLLYALGSSDGRSSGYFSQHYEKGIVRMNLKTGAVNTTVEEWVEDPRTTLRSAHGSLMVVGWVLFMTIGRFIAAYGRKIPYWWQFHVGFQMLAMVSISFSLALILKAVGTQGSHFNNVHGIVGIVLVVAAFVQTALGGMAHFLRTVHSPVFPNGVHQYLGHIIWWGAIYNIPLGLRQYQVAPFTTEGNSFWAVWVCWLLVMVVITIYIFWNQWAEQKAKQEEKARQRAQGEADPYDIYTTSHYDPSLINQLERVEKASPSILEIILGHKILTGGATLHLGLALALALLFVTLPNTKPAEPYHYCPNCTEITMAFNSFTIPVHAHPAAAVAASEAFFCKGFDFGTSSIRHVVEFSPSVVSSHVTHAKLFSVPYDTQSLGTFACLDALDDAVPIYTWSVGQGSFILPAEVGLRVGSDSTIRYVVLQLRYSNPSLATDLTDSSGVVVKMTTTLRAYDAGVLGVGVGPTTISLAPLKSEVEIAGQCSSDKTSVLSESLNVFSIAHDTRKYGEVAWLEQWTYSALTQEVTFNNIIGQSYAQTAYDPVIASSTSSAVIAPGDLLIAHCIYDTQSSNTTVSGGPGAFEEHCWSWLWYYPKTDALKCYSSQTPYNPSDGHFRPDRNSSTIM